MLIEILFGPMLVGLFWWEVVQLGLLPAGAANVLPADQLATVSQWMLWMYLGHALMLTLLMIATFIDFDEQTIPDAVTIPGTTLALAIQTFAATKLPVAIAPLALPWVSQAGLMPTLFCSPQPLDPVWRTVTGLVVAEAIFSAWCFALANRRWIMRKGFSKAIQFFLAGLVKYDLLLFGRFKMKAWKLLGVIWTIGSVAIAGVFFGIGGTAWIALLSAIVGMGIGGGQIWAVRIMARLGLGKEAMGFGDVTLMAMIGAFLGWQASVFCFFLAPFTAIIIVVASWLMTGNRMLPFGPYLAAASMLVVIFWDRIWNNWGADMFILGPLIGAILGVCLVAMCAMLFAFRKVEQALAGLGKP